MNSYINAGYSKQTERVFYYGSPLSIILLPLVLNQCQ